MILTLDKEKGRVSLSTKKLEPTPGDMVRDPDLVYARADEMAAAFRWAPTSVPSLMAVTGIPDPDLVEELQGTLTGLLPSPTSWCLTHADLL